MIIAAGRDEQIIPVRKGQHVADEARGKARVESLHAPEPELLQCAEPPVHVFTEDELVAVAVARVRQHGDPAAGKDGGNRLLRPDVALPHPQLVEVLLHRHVLGRRVAVLRHQIRDVRLPRVVLRQQLVNLLLREGKAEFRFQKLQPGAHLVHPDAVPLVHQLLYRRRFGVVAITENVVLPLLIPAGELHPRHELRVALLQALPNEPAALNRIVIRECKQFDAGLFHKAQDFRRGISPVGDRRVHVQVYFFRICHTVILLLPANCVCLFYRRYYTATGGHAQEQKRSVKTGGAILQGAVL